MKLDEAIETLKNFGYLVERSTFYDDVVTGTHNEILKDNEFDVLKNIKKQLKGCGVGVSFLGKDMLQVFKNGIIAEIYIMFNGYKGYQVNVSLFTPGMNTMRYQFSDPELAIDKVKSHINRFK